jgi:hypothetical protein
MAVVLTGAVPVTAALPVFLAYFLPAFFLQGLALRLLARGMAPAGISTVFDLVRLPANLRATLRLVSRSERGFTVTAKGRTGRERARVGLPRLHTVLVAASIASAAWFVATSAGLTPMRYEVPWAANGSALWLTVNSVQVQCHVRLQRVQPRSTASRDGPGPGGGPRPGGRARSAVSGALPDVVPGVPGPAGAGPAPAGAAADGDAAGRDAGELRLRDRPARPRGRPGLTGRAARTRPPRCGSDKP